MASFKGKYRVRTWLRVYAPGFIARRATKGTHDCGNHEWYRSEGDVWRCYHCEVGELLCSPGTEPEMYLLRRAKRPSRV